jgi:sulfite reductase alpha subunit
MGKHKTPQLDELKKGKWPSFVKELEQAASKSERTDDLIGQLEKSYDEGITHWKHGGMVGVRGYGSGVVGRFSELPEEFPGAQEYHTARVFSVPGLFYTSDILRKLADICDKYAGGIFNFHGSTGDIQILGFTQAEAEYLFQSLSKIGFDLGGSGSALRSPSCCVGPARCEWSCFDTLHANREITNYFLDEVHRPPFYYKFKIKFSGCPIDCTSSGARSDLSVIGVWKDNIKIDQEKVAEYASKFDIIKYVINKCPSKCISFKNNKISIDNSFCVKCMHCIATMPKALKPGDIKGAQLRLGAKAPVVHGPRLGFLLLPFYDINKDKEDGYSYFTDLVQRIWDFWDEYGKNRERVGELVQRFGIGNSLEKIGIEPHPAVVAYPRINPYIKFEEQKSQEGE